MRIQEIIRRPLITEKSSLQRESTNVLTLEVDMRANKLLVKDAVEKAFDVTVVDVNILIMAAKTSRRGSAIRIRRPKWKKAVVTLQTGDRIQLFEGV